MASLLYTCPETRQQAPTGIQIDAKSLRKAWSKKLKVQCPCCGNTHQFLVRVKSVREHQAGLRSFRSMRRIDARRKNASALRLRFSQSWARRPAKNEKHPS